MEDNTASSSQELHQAFAEYERDVKITNYQVGCILGIIFMPAGICLDWVVYDDKVQQFFIVRLICSLLLGLIWFLFKTPWGRSYYQLLGLIEVFLPLASISLMIQQTEGASSPYYAGLTLVLIGAGIVLRWGLLESIIVLTMSLGLYLLACFTHSPDAPVNSGRSAIDIANSKIFFNNLYFLVVTGVFVITGNYFFNRLRFSEFTLRYELDKSRQQLEQNNQKLIELDHFKSRFFANVSHELRTPLTLLLTPLESLLHHYGREFSTDIQEHLQTMHTNGMRLLKLINDLLDLVRMDSGTLTVNKEPVEIESFVNGLVSSVKKTADEKGVALHAKVAPTIERALIDRDKMEKVFLNLIFNALKFTPVGGKVEVEIDREEGEEDPCLVCQISDTGMGISQEKLDRIFDRFWQADTTSQRKFQGAGIGLALVKELVEAQGGSVEVDSRLEQGTRFVLRLPTEFHHSDHAEETALPAETEETEWIGASSGDSGNGEPEKWLSNLYRRAELFPPIPQLRDTQSPDNLPLRRKANRPVVLVADDEPDMLRFLKSQLSAHYEVLEATDGLQASEKARQFLPEVALLDMMMPEKDGLQVCRELRNHTPTEGIPIVLLTARADDETKLSGLDAGANDFLSKPFSITELHLRLRNLVSAHRLKQELARQNQRLEATLEELKETETQLVQTEKLASLGRLSAGIIHEINNPLNFAKTGLHTIHTFNKELPESEKEEFDEIITDIDEGIDRVKTIVSDLRTFTHPDEQNFDEVEVKPIVETALRFLSHEWKDTVRIEQSIPEGERIWANASSVSQVVTNLLQNSLDAIMEKEFPEDEVPTVTIQLHHEGNKSILSIRDNGNGVPQKILNNIFDPFFTSKDVGKGMGLGLSICYRIMENHGGSIRVDTEAGKFAEFKLEFPAETEVGAGTSP